MRSADARWRATLVVLIGVFRARDAATRCARPWN